jgi:hypothetical protein
MARDDLLKDGADAELSEARSEVRWADSNDDALGSLSVLSVRSGPNASDASWLFIHNAKCILLTRAEPAQYARFFRLCVGASDA